LRTATDAELSGALADVPGRQAQPSLANYWHPIALASEVDERPKKFTLLGEDVVAFRDTGGVVAMRDLCIHRGTRLSLGTVVDGCIVCPYHGWEYDSTGTCVKIPSLPSGSAIPKKARTTVYATEEMYGLVWVALSDPVAPIPSWPENVWSQDSRYTVFLAYNQVWRGNAGRVIENGMDFSHFEFVHRGLTGLADGPIIKPHDVDVTDYGLHYSYYDSRITREYLVYAPFTMHDRKVEANGDVTVLTLIASPIDATTTHVYQFVARNHDGAVAFENKGLQQAEPEVMAALEKVTEQDRMIVESQRPELIPLDLREELHLKVPDASGIAYRKLLAAIAGSAPFMP